MTKNAPRTPPKAPKLSPRGRSWRHHGPSWAQLAANLAHLASILGPSSPQLRQKSPPNRARNLKKRPQTPQDHPEGRQRAPGQLWGSNFHSFGVDFGLNFLGFSFSLSFYFSWPPCLKFGAVAAWRAQRTGYKYPYSFDAARTESRTVGTRSVAGRRDRPRGL